MTTYEGSCHCGMVRFEADAEINQVRECDCSVCRRRGALTFRVPPDRMRLLTPIGQLAVYRWGTMTGADYFCPNCGIMPFRRPSAPTTKELADGAIRFDGWAVNVRCLPELDISRLPKVHIRGSELNI